MPVMAGRAAPRVTPETQVTVVAAALVMSAVRVMERKPVVAAAAAVLRAVLRAVNDPVHNLVVAAVAAQVPPMLLVVGLAELPAAVMAVLAVAATPMESPAIAGLPVRVAVAVAVATTVSMVAVAVAVVVADVATPVTQEIPVTPEALRPQQPPTIV
jgi:hypothetical protein